MSDKRDVQSEQESSVEETVQAAEAAQETQQNEENVSQETDVNAETDLAQRIYELETALSEAQATIKEQQDSVLRAHAEMENARRRAEAEVEKARKFALERFAGELLPVVDNLERAIEMSDSENEAIKPLLEGVEMTHRTFINTIEKFGLSLIDPQGETFNPDLHQAMSMQESAEAEPNTVIAVMQKGYQINGRLLRPAMVMVSRAPSDGVDTQA